MVNLAEKNQALGVSQCLPNPLLLLAQPGLSPVVRETLAGRKQESCLVLKGSLRAWQEEESQNNSKFRYQDIYNQFGVFIRRKHLAKQRLIPDASLFFKNMFGELTIK